MSREEEFEDFKSELAQTEAIYKMPFNGLSLLALQNVKQSSISKKIEDRYKNMSLEEFLGATPKKGEKHSQSKLTEKEVLEIRASELTPKELSLLYDVKLPNIYKILSRQRWKHI